MGSWTWKSNALDPQSYKKESFLETQLGKQSYIFERREHEEFIRIHRRRPRCSCWSSCWYRYQERCQAANRQVKTTYQNDPRQTVCVTSGDEMPTTREKEKNREAFRSGLVKRYEKRKKDKKK